MSVAAELVHRMVTDVFNERDAHRRAEAIAAVFADSVVFVDPEGTVTGLAAVAEKVHALLEGLRGLCFVFLVRSRRWPTLAWTGGSSVLPAPIQWSGEPTSRSSLMGRIVRLYTLIDPS